MVTVVRWLVDGGDNLCWRARRRCSLPRRRAPRVPLRALYPAGGCAPPASGFGVVFVSRPPFVPAGPAPSPPPARARPAPPPRGGGGPFRPFPCFGRAWGRRRGGPGRPARAAAGPLPRSRATHTRGGCSSPLGRPVGRVARALRGGRPAGRPLWGVLGGVAAGGPFARPRWRLWPPRPPFPPPRCAGARPPFAWGAVLRRASPSSDGLGTYTRYGD